MRNSISAFFLQAECSSSVNVKYERHLTGGQLSFKLMERQWITLEAEVSLSQVNNNALSLFTSSQRGPMKVIGAIISSAIFLFTAFSVSPIYNLF